MEKKERKATFKGIFRMPEYYYDLRSAMAKLQVANVTPLKRVLVVIDAFLRENMIYARVSDF